MKKIIFYVKFLTNFGQNFRKTNEWGTLLFRSSFKAKTPDLFCIILRGGWNCTILKPSIKNTKYYIIHIWKRGISGGGFGGFDGKSPN